MKRCIFHYLHPVEEKPGIGSALRPNKMLKAFQDIGYDVFVIDGYSGDRKKKIQEVKKHIRSGVKYDFIYSESVNDPTPLSDADHFPRHPFMDFNFLKFCRKNGIPVGLFYRDMHWQFSVYRDHVAWWKQMIAIPLFRRDLRMYRKCVDTLYVPSTAMGAYIPHMSTHPLPPGGESCSLSLTKSKETDVLQIFYVGNVLGVYDITAFCKAVNATEKVHLTICTPVESWNVAKTRYEPYLCERIQVIHKNSTELLPYYQEADLFCCCLEENEYTRLAMPIKVFEAINHGVPVMITKGIAAADLVASANCGWVVENHFDAYVHLLQRLKEDEKELQEKTENTVSVASEHTWSKRALTVANDLLTSKKE